MTLGRIVLRNVRLIDPAQELDAVGTLLVDDGAIAGVVLAGDGDVSPLPGDEIIDLEGCWLSPGWVDLRASLREPGYEHKEDIRSGLGAAAAGGFTAVCAMPDTNPVADCEAVILQMLERAQAAGGARLWPIGAATAGLAGTSLAPMGELAAAGCVAVTQGELPVASARLMRRVLEYAGGFDLPVFSSAIEPSLTGSCDEGPWSTRLGLPGSPAAAERIAVARDLALCELTGDRLHLSRITTAAAVALVADAKDRGLPVTCDVTAHHLTLTAAALHDYDTNTKVWPPFRSEADRQALIEGLSKGVIDAVASDHQPHHAEDKAREFPQAAAGLSALETVAPLVQALVAQGSLSLSRAASLLSSGPRRVLGRPALALAVGAPADVTAIDPDATWIPGPDALSSRGKNTPFSSQELTGKARLTVVGGRIVWQDSATGGGAT